MMCMINILETGKCHAVPCWYSTQTREYSVDWRWLLSCEQLVMMVFLAQFTKGEGASSHLPPSLKLRRPSPSQKD